MTTFKIESSQNQELVISNLDHWRELVKPVLGLLRWIMNQSFGI